MEETIISLLGGRVAEQLVLNDISTGASNDIERASKIARDMVTRYGMSDKIGTITFGSGQEYSEFVDLNQLGAVVTKGVSLTPWEGNPAPRIMETSSGMINAVGLQNPGIDVFIERDIPFLQKFNTKIIVNVCGNSVSDYLQVVERLSETVVDMLEINISCSNVEHGGIATINDVLEFIMAGATGIAIGTANFNNPFVMPEIISELSKYMEENNIETLDEIRGIVG